MMAMSLYWPFVVVAVVSVAVQWDVAMSGVVQWNTKGLGVGGVWCSFTSTTVSADCGGDRPALDEARVNILSHKPVNLGCLLLL